MKDKLPPFDIESGWIDDTFPPLIDDDAKKKDSDRDYEKPIEKQG